MKRGSTDNISIVIIGLNDPEADRAPKKGNEHIKIMGGNMRKNDPQVDLSIVVVSFNTLEMTRECLTSVYQHLEGLTAQVIVVDNNSSDGSSAMVQNEFPSAELIVNADNRGFAAANNQGFELASGQYVLLLNSDTIVLGNVLKQSIDYLVNHSKVGAMGCRVLNTDKTMQPTCSGYPTLFRLLAMTLALDRLSPLFDKYLLRSWRRDAEREVEVISGCYLLTRREVLEQIGGLDERFFFFGEETDWCLHMRKSGWKLMFAPVGEIVHHGGGSVKKLNHRRDLMLTEATIRLHRKNGGLVSAFAAFSILAVFNYSRALAWSVCSLLKPRCQQRATHFRQVAWGTFATWPKEKF